MSNNQIASVNFHGHALTVITSASQQLVAMKPVAEGIGLDWKSQHSRIQRHPVLQSVMVMMTTTGADGKSYQMLCLPLDYLNGWLFGVDANRVREDIRDTLIMYQRECYQVLAAYWQQGEEGSPHHQTQATPSLLGRRWLITFDHEGKEHVRSVPDDAVVMTPSQLLSWLADPERIAVDADMLFQFVAAASERLRHMHGYQAVQLKRAKEAGLQTKLV